MKFEDVKVGQTLIHEFGMGEYKVVAVHDKIEKVVIEASSDEDIYIVEGFRLGNYSILPDFFRVDKTYRLKGASSPSSTLKILNIYTVENPDEEDDRKTAIALLTKTNGKQYITQLQPNQFKYYEAM